MGSDGFAGPSSPTLSTSSSLSSGFYDSKQRKPRPPTNLPVPVPVPNLTKKSRGRRVPTVSSLEELRKVAASATEEGASAPAAAATTTATSARGRKTRGAAAAGASGAKGSRMYLCDVEGCGKCFARGEHLKRHVRSIHTNEKPHTCPYPGCGKDFSRHDNLGQHMRVHKDYVPPPSPVKA
ncbi:hypothetical protein DFP72DRAFT_820235 [Ephemerocybe angulata]|uniref:C2H2-type domain-containing protein n=1 Tax=Ephemerocybe angulata TaxID=980116 RepID=A0A8H6LY51_9AGAR|nr:hypothetical protein DFP72DRAFT_820235 [Tulosesus angulatus]